MAGNKYWRLFNIKRINFANLNINILRVFLQFPLFVENTFFWTVFFLKTFENIGTHRKYSGKPFYEKKKNAVLLEVRKSVGIIFAKYSPKN